MTDTICLHGVELYKNVELAEQEFRENPAPVDEYMAGLAMLKVMHNTAWYQCLPVLEGIIGSRKAEPLSLAAELLLRPAGNGKITLTGSAYDLMVAIDAGRINDISGDDLNDLFFRIENDSFITVAKSAPYLLANSFLFDNTKSVGRLEKWLPDYILSYVKSRRENQLAHPTVLNNDAVLCDEISAPAISGRIRVNSSRYARREP